MRPALILAMAGLAAACASTGVIETGPVVRPLWPVETREVTAAGHFAIALTNTSDRPLCFESHQWPNSYGLFALHMDVAFVETGGERIPVADRLSDYCPACQIRIAPGDTATGVVKFENFPGVDFTAPAAGRRLSYRMRQAPCLRRSNWTTVDEARGLTHISYWRRWGLPRWWPD